MKLKRNQTNVNLGYGYRSYKRDISSPEYLTIQKCWILEELEPEYNLDLEYTPISKLPDNLSVGGDLNLRYTPISKLPDNLSVDRDLYLSHTPISKKYTEKEIRKMVKHVGVKIYL